VLLLIVPLLASACKSTTDSQTLRPRQLRDVPANKLAFNFQADVQPPENLASMKRSLCWRFSRIRDKADERRVAADR
jgi:hypothetical protein